MAGQAAFVVTVTHNTRANQPDLTPRQPPPPFSGAACFKNKAVDEEASANPSPPCKTLSMQPPQHLPPDVLPVGKRLRGQDYRVGRAQLRLSILFDGQFSS
ncbi:MAG: hypothetical protein NTX45_22375 [Proteobacteria bacterium]|nr:hypothetical protein [Pseudomonadota bacterium]